MRPFHHIAFGFLLVALCLTVCGAQRHGLRARQESNDLSVASTQAPATSAAHHDDASAVASTESPSAPSNTATSGSDTASKTSTGLPVTSESATSTTEPESSTFTGGAPSPSGTTAASAAAASSTAVVYSGKGLPLQPKITPAIGIAGIVLIATGVIYTLIGIKKRWISISLSTAYLVALAVTVLIVYVMNPPVTDAIQGAFFVASCVTGVIFGAVALIFPDVTDGLGCLLGGFCVSMWFLVLKDGGLIISTTGKAIFIALMSLAGFSLSFSHYTRSYGLIACTSFAGATIIILGIDCYSRAGLKEFWLYLWALNNNTFPLNTNTYPITRGIRVEIAGIIVICLLGLFSQFRLWKVVKEKREAKAAERREQERDRDLEEEEIGRRVEKTTNRERAQWEAVYGSKTGVTATHADSGIGSATESLRKGTVSVRESSRSNSESEGLEMDDLGAARDGSDQGLISRRESEAPKEDIQQVDTEGTTTLGDHLSSRRSSATHRTFVRKASEADTSTQKGIPGSMPGTPCSASVPPPPPIVPLPFVVPTGDDDALSPSDDQLSIVSASPVDVNRLSVLSAAQRLSKQGTIASRESLTIPHIDDDKASSVAATLDEMNEEVYSLPPLSRVSTPWGEALDPLDVPLPPSPYPGEDPGCPVTEALPSLPSETQDDRTPKDQDVQHPQQAFLELVPPQSLTKGTNPQSEHVPGSKRSSLNEYRRHSEVSTTLDEARAGQGPTRPRIQSDAAQSVTGSLGDHLPDRLSKVMLSYRTNEWAKHLALAEQPELETIPEPTSPGIAVDRTFSQAVYSTAPAKEDNNRSARSSRDLSQLPQTNPYRQSILMRSSTTQSEYEPPVSVSRRSSTATVSTPNGKKPPAHRSSSASTTPVYSSRSAPSAPPRGIRSSSTPLMHTVAEQTLTESPSEENAETTAGGYTPSPMPSNTLMGRREQLINNKMSTISFATPNIAISAPSDSGSLRRSSRDLDPDNISLAERKQLLEEEDMPLSKRKQLIQQQQQQQQQRLSSQNLQQQSHRSQPRTTSWATPVQGFDSHQPKRSPSGMDAGKREVMMANWRHSVRQDLQPAQTKKADESHRQAMIASTRNQQMAQQQQSMAASYRESMMDSVMRRGDMLDLHQHALRRMQAAANKHA